MVLSRSALQYCMQVQAAGNVEKLEVEGLGPIGQRSFVMQ